MKKINLFAKVAVAALLVASALAFTGCKPQVEFRDRVVSVYAKWVEPSSYGNSYYEISTTGFKNYGDTYDSYEGDSLVIKPVSETEGFIYIKYTKAYCSIHSDSSTYTYKYDNDAADVGKWYAIAYKGLTSSSIKISGALGAVDGHYMTSTSTLEEAIAEFTIENGYFGYYSDCVKENSAK